jgi:hypothetical protein
MVQRVTSVRARQARKDAAVPVRKEAEARGETGKRIAIGVAMLGKAE